MDYVTDSILQKGKNQDKFEGGIQTYLQPHLTKTKLSRNQWSLVKSKKYHKLLEEELTQEQKKKKNKPWTLGSRTLPRQGTRTWDAPFLPTKNFHQIRTVF